MELEVAINRLREHAAKYRPAGMSKDIQVVLAEIERLQGIIDQERLSALACSNAGDEAIRWLRSEVERLQTENERLRRDMKRWPATQEWDADND